ncbi:transposase [Azospirillum soli]|uniref:transposase n=1 Tax=Azospirillum soli TaxID=1304799 RepID=UPI003CCE8C13
MLADTADSGYRGDVAATKVGDAGDWRLEIVKRSDQVKGFLALPKQWLVERTLSWLTRCRRLVRRDEQYLRTSVAFIRIATTRLMRRLARK